MSLMHKKTTGLHCSGEPPMVERGFSAYLKQLRKNPRLRFNSKLANPKRKK